jgi:hypothetical protein
MKEYLVDGNYLSFDFRQAVIQAHIYGCTPKEIGFCCRVEERLVVKVLDQIIEKNKAPEPKPELTSQQKEGIVSLTASSITVGEIAGILNIDIEEVEKQLCAVTQACVVSEFGDEEETPGKEFNILDEPLNDNVLENSEALKGFGQSPSTILPSGIGGELRGSGGDFHKAFASGSLADSMGSFAGDFRTNRMGAFAGDFGGMTNFAGDLSKNFEMSKNFEGDLMKNFGMGSMRDASLPKTGKLGKMGMFGEEGRTTQPRE